MKMSFDSLVATLGGHPTGKDPLDKSLLPLHLRPLRVVCG